jgi:hypothetical protein
MRIMPETGVILEIDHPHFVIRLDEDLLKVVSPGASSGALWCCFFLFFSYVFSDGVEV